MPSLGGWHPYVRGVLQSKDSFCQPFEHIATAWECNRNPIMPPSGVEPCTSFDPAAIPRLPLKIILFQELFVSIISQTRREPHGMPRFRRRRPKFTLLDADS